MGDIVFGRNMNLLNSEQYRDLTKRFSEASAGAYVVSEFPVRSNTSHFLLSAIVESGFSELYVVIISKIRSLPTFV